MEVPEHDLGVVDVIEFANLAITLLNKVYFHFNGLEYFVKLII